MIAEAILDMTAEAVPRMVCQCIPCNQTVEVHRYYPDEDWREAESLRIKVSLMGGLGWCDNHKVVTETLLAVSVAVLAIQVVILLMGLSFWSITKIKKGKTYTLSQIIADWNSYPASPYQPRRVAPVVLDDPIISMEMMEVGEIGSEVGEVGSNDDEQ